MKKKSPQDLTGRNNLARKKEIAELKKRVKRLEDLVAHYFGAKIATYARKEKK